MRNNDVEAKLKSAVGRLTPDALDSILAQCDERQAIYVIQPQKATRRWAQTAGAIAAAFALVFGGLLAFNRVTYGRIDSWVMLDVNPSIELRLNRDDRVVEVETKNEDAVVILDNMDLEDTHIDVAVNALIGSMLKYGYIQDTANSVLLSVESVDGEKSAVLQRTLTESISQQLDMVGGAVISQSLTEDVGLEGLAGEHQISYGKAALIQKILDQNSHLLFADLAVLPVNELNLLVGSKRIEADGMEAVGSASDTAYIGEEMAKQTALEHAGITNADSERLYAELDYDDGAMIYEVEFYHGGVEYEYEIRAEDGTVIQFDRESGGDESRRAERQDISQSQDSNNFIGEARAVEAAQAHAGVQADDSLKSELDKDDGMYIYEVEFHAGGQEYEYEIDAATGEIISWETER